MIAILLLAGATAAAAPCPERPPAEVEIERSSSRMADKGAWGGANLLMEVTDTGAALTYPCAHGTIDQRIELDGKGRFEVHGTHTRERGGPVRSDETPDRHPARYTGRVDGKIMTLVVTLADTKETVGTFSLTLGERPELHRCA